VTRAVIPLRDHLWCVWVCECNMGWFRIRVVRVVCDDFVRLKEVVVGEPLAFE
jgi:hypothetical protein